MASVQFHIHTDKENASSTGGKAFQGGGFPHSKTPRRALGSVNEAARVGGPVPGPQAVKSGKWSTATVDAKQKKSVSDRLSKPRQRQQPDKENASVQPGSQKVQQAASSVLPASKQHPALPPIEYMPPPGAFQDEDEDILPMSERASSYVHKLLSWRPPCLFGTQPESDGEEEKEHRRFMEELDNLPLPNHHGMLSEADLNVSYEDLDLDCIELPSVDCFPDSSSAGAEILSEAGQPPAPQQVPPSPCHSKERVCSANASLSELNDSMGIGPSLGSLQIMDHSSLSS